MSLTTKFTLDRFLRIVWKGKWLVLAPFVIITVGTLAVLRTLPDQFRSETLIIVVPQRVSESYVRATVTTRIDDRLQAMSQQILSRTRLERIIQDFSLYPEERRTGIMEEVVEGMRRDIDVRMVKGDAFRISYVAKSPQVAMKVAERLASLFIEENLRDREVLAEATNQFLEAQLDDARTRLVEQEKKLETYRRAHQGELPSQLQTNLQVLQNAHAQYQALGESINRDRDRRLLLEKMIEEARQPVAPIEAAQQPEGERAIVRGDSPAAQLESARLGLQALMARFRPEHPDVIRMRKVIQELEQKAAADDSAATGSPKRSSAATQRLAQLTAELQNLDLQIAAKAREQKAVQRTITVYQARADAAPGHESDLIALTRDYETLQKVYTTLLSKSEESKVAANLERRQIGEQFKILDAARLPQKPFSPNRPLVSAFGAVGGFAIGVALAVLWGLRDSTLRTEEDVARVLTLPVLAIIPVMTTTAARLRQRQRTRWLAVSWATAALLLAATAALVWTRLPEGW